GGQTLVAVWTDGTATALNAKLDVANSKGSLAQLSDLPVVVDRSGDPVHAAGQRAATFLAAALVGSEEGHALLAQFPESLRQQALLASAHDFIGSVMDERARDKAVSPPPVLSSKQPSNAGIESLMFVIDGRPLP